MLLVYLLTVALTLYADGTSDLFSPYYLLLSASGSSSTMTAEAFPGLDDAFDSILLRA